MLKVILIFGRRHQIFYTCAMNLKENSEIVLEILPIHEYF